MRFVRSLATRFGVFTVTEQDGGITGVVLPGRGERPPDTERSSPLLEKALAELAEYLAGKRKTFEDLPLAPEGTPFRKKVWRSLTEKVPFGKTVSYGELAALAGSPCAARAVGSAMRANPVAVFVPCHRVIASDGGIGGYGGGAELKCLLLKLENHGKNRF